MIQMTRSQKYKTIGKCIYCGDTRNPSNLTDEHIIPLAIGGHLIFEKASCNTCQRAIEKWEGKLNNGMFGPVRPLLGLRGRGKFKTRHNLKIFNTENPTGAWRLENAPKTQHCTVIGMTALLDEAPIAERTGKASSLGWYCKNLDPLKGFAPTDKSSAYVNMNDHTDFTRLLAKIAHGYWYAERGDANFFPFFETLITGRSWREATEFLGGNEALNHYYDDLHYLNLGTRMIRGVETAYVDIALFSCFPVFKGYRAYVGTLHQQAYVPDRTYDPIPKYENGVEHGYLPTYAITFEPDTIQ